MTSARVTPASSVTIPEDKKKNDGSHTGDGALIVTVSFPNDSHGRLLPRRRIKEGLVDGWTSITKPAVNYRDVQKMANRGGNALGSK